MPATLLRDWKVPTLTNGTAITEMIDSVAGGVLTLTQGTGVVALNIDGVTIANLTSGSLIMFTSDIAAPPTDDLPVTYIASGLVLGSDAFGAFSLNDSISPNGSEGIIVEGSAMTASMTAAGQGSPFVSVVGTNPGVFDVFALQITTSGTNLYTLNSFRDVLSWTGSGTGVRDTAATFVLVGNGDNSANLAQFLEMQVWEGLVTPAQVQAAMAAMAAALSAANPLTITLPAVLLANRNNAGVVTLATAPVSNTTVALTISQGTIASSVVIPAGQTSAEFLFDPGPSGTVNIGALASQVTGGWNNITAPVITPVIPPWTGLNFTLPDDATSLTFAQNDSLPAVLMTFQDGAGEALDGEAYPFGVKVVLYNADGPIAGAGGPCTMTFGKGICQGLYLLSSVDLANIGNFSFKPVGAITATAQPMSFLAPASTNEFACPLQVKAF